MKVLNFLWLFLTFFAFINRRGFLLDWSFVIYITLLTLFFFNKVSYILPLFWKFLKLLGIFQSSKKEVVCPFESVHLTCWTFLFYFHLWTLREYSFEIFFDFFFKNFCIQNIIFKFCKFSFLSDFRVIQLWVMMAKNTS